MPFTMDPPDWSPMGGIFVNEAGDLMFVDMQDGDIWGACVWRHTCLWGGGGPFLLVCVVVVCVCWCVCVLVRVVRWCVFVSVSVCVPVCVCVCVALTVVSG